MAAVGTYSRLPTVIPQLYSTVFSLNARRMQGSTSSLPHRIFSYGTIKKGQPNYYHFLNEENGLARFVCSAKTVDKWPLIIATKYNVPFLLYAKDKGEIVHGEVYEVDDKMLEFMDKFEGHPDVYQRDHVLVCSDEVKVTHPSDGTKLQHGDSNSHLTCWCYFLKTFPSQLMSLPMLENYDDTGGHHKHYHPEEDLNGPDDIWAALLESV